MKTIKNKEILVGADFAGYPLKEAVCEHLRKKRLENNGYRGKKGFRPERYGFNVSQNRSESRFNDSGKGI